MSKSDEIKQKILERGYWEIDFIPSKYVEKKFTHQQLQDLLDKHQVKYRGLYYPSFTRGDYGDIYNVQGHIEAYEHWGEIINTFRFFQSGQFVQYIGMPEDRLADAPPLFVKWDHAMQKPAPAQVFLEPTMTLYQLTEIFLFASRLASEGVFDKQVQITIKLHNMNHRILKSLDLMRAPFHHKECHTEIITIGPITMTPDKLKEDHDNLAIESVIEILSLFGFTSEHIRKVFEEDQKKFYERRF